MFVPAYLMSAKKEDEAKKAGALLQPYFSPTSVKGGPTSALLQ